MPRYYFHVRDGFSQDDNLGTELPDIYAAQSEAVRFAGEILTHLGPKFWDGSKWSLEVADEQRRVLFVLNFSVEEGRLGDAPDD